MCIRDSPSPFYWLQAVHEPELAFLVADPHVILPTYDPDLTAARHALAITNDEEMVVLGIVTLRAKPLSASINLRAPLVINACTRQGRQIVLEEDKFSLRYPLRDFLGRAEALSAAGDGMRTLAGQALRQSG